MPAVAAVVGFLGTTTGAIVAAGAISAVQSMEQQKQIKRAEKKQAKFLAKERELVGEPEQFEAGIRESFLEREVPRLEAEFATRGMTLSSEAMEEQLGVGIEADRLSREAALRRWQVRANVAQRQIETAYSGGARVPGPGPGAAFLGGVIGQIGKEAQTGAFAETISPIFTGPTPGTPRRREPMKDDFFGQDVFAAA